MISSKALIDQTGISRATLNNYIQLGILPKPDVQSLSASADEGGARVLGFFPDDALERVQAVQILKTQGLSMTQVAERLAQTDALLEVQELQQEELISRPAMRSIGRSSSTARSENPPANPLGNLSLSLDTLSHPAYMINYNFELTWLNEYARKEVFGFLAPPAKSVDCNVLGLLSKSEVCLSLQDQRALVGILLQLANSRIGYEPLRKLVLKTDPEMLPLLDEVATKVNDQEQAVNELEFFQKDARGQLVCYRIYAVYFREGILVVHAPSQERGDDLLNFLARRDQVIQSLLSKRLPVMTPLAVVVADLQNSVRICSELPPDEYFALINEIWATMGPVLRKYTGTHGKHVGDGVVYYFFPQAESNYLFNAIACADELRLAMRKISSNWQHKKNWFTELQLNIGLHEGQEWLGSFQSANHIEFAVLGNTINQASRLSDFARHGSIWATKDLISKLSDDERSRIEFGVLRKSQENGDRFVPSSYAQIEPLIDLKQDKHEKLRDIAQLPVAEIKRVSHTRLY
ncbi:adenylate/guanylate cyclase domain-containing protein [Polynucleobacter necessarius]|uniref:adenylate/guanylate cyclase domain-containing protein n=1 Tax=Polynucleobacter necessarius TaxID=576610 RepID=UPI000E09BF4F|nr:adenylate/guanylate cyclase domain-containing protein [Polynucleobacter necessarius]